MIARGTFALLLLSAAASCSDSTDISKFKYGGTQPGVGMAEGGEIRHENVRFLGQPVQTWVMVYQYTGPSLADTAPFADPGDGKGTYGNCVDERSGSPTWPFTPIKSTARYLDLPKVELSGPGITGSLAITKTTPPNTVGNSTFRSYGFTYGGGAPDPTGTKPLGFNATVGAEISMPDSDYTLDIGKGSTPLTYHMPAAFQAPLGIGGKDVVMIPAGKELEYTWDAPANDKGASGTEHNRKTYFNFTLFADPTSANPPQFICFPDVDGHQVIPQTVIDAIPSDGLIVNADLSHYLDTRPTEGSETRRFDLVSIYCNISAYHKQ